MKGGFKVEKNNKKNGLPTDLDDLRLKDHLDASFDLDNITVSEDLIKRTLKAIGESQPQEEQPKDLNKIKRFPVRRLVSAAAVLLVLLVGINVLQNGLVGNKKDSQSSQDSATAEKSATEPAAMDIYSAAAEDSAPISGSNETNSVLDSTAVDGEMQEDDDNSDKFSTRITQDTNTEGGGVSSSFGGNLFSGLYPITFDSVEAFSLTKNDGTQITLTDVGDKVSQLYTLLDGYTLVASESEVSDTDNNWIYKAEISIKENQTYTIIMGDSIQVVINQESADSNPAAYKSENIDTLIKQMDEFFNSIK